MKFQPFKRTAVLLILIMIMQFVLRLPFLEEPLERDEGTYGYVAQRILEGEIPYRDIFDHKPPVVYYLYALVVKLFGNSILALRTFTAFYSLLTTFGIFGLGYFLFGQSGGILSAFLFALFSGGPFIQGTSSNTETFMVLPLVLALLMFYQWMVKRYLWLMFGTGFFSGLAVMIKQVAIFNFATLLGFLLIDLFKKRSKFSTFKEICVLTAGFLIFPLFFIFYFWFKGALVDFFYCNIVVNQHYLRFSPVPLLFVAPRFGLYRIWQQVKMENGILWIFSFLGLLIIFTKDRVPKLFLLAFWAIFSFLGVSAGKLFFGHYFIQVIPALCLLSAYMLTKVAESKQFSLFFFTITLLIILTALNLPHQFPFYTKFNPYQISEAKYGCKTFGVAYAFSQEMLNIIKPEDGIFVWAAEPEVYFYLKKKAPSKYPYYLIWMSSIINPDKTLPKGYPKYVVFGDYHPLFINLVKMLKNNYNLKEKFWGWSLYERK